MRISLTESEAVSDSITESEPVSIGFATWINGWIAKFAGCTTWIAKFVGWFARWGVVACYAGEHANLHTADATGVASGRASSSMRIACHSDIAILP